MKLNEQILNQVNEGIVICNINREIIFNNTASKELLGSLIQGVTKVEGNKGDVLKYMSDGVTLFTESQLPMNQALQGKYMENVEMLIVFQDHSKDSIWVSVNSSPLRNDRGEIAAGMITIRDQTEKKKKDYDMSILNGKLQSKNSQLKKANNNLKRITCELKNRNSELNSFAARVAHDLKTPLNPITGFIELIKDDLNEILNSKQHETFNMVLESVHSMNFLITELLEYSRLEKINEEKAPVELRQLFGEIESLMNIALQEREGTIKVDNNLPTINCNKTPAKQLFQNVISNSIKYQKDQIPPEISITCDSPTSSEDYYTIKIKDNGKGFNQDQAEKLFEPMYRLKNDTVKGHGLGLAISAKAAEMEGWTIKAFGIENQGAEFQIKIPGSQAIQN